MTPEWMHAKAEALTEECFALIRDPAVATKTARALLLSTIKVGMESKPDKVAPGGMNIPLLQYHMNTIRHTLNFDNVPHVNLTPEMWKQIADALEQVIEAAPNSSGLDSDMGFILEGANVGELAAYDYAVHSHCQAVNKILDGQDTQGSNNEPWGSVSKRLIALVKQTNQPQQ